MMIIQLIIAVNTLAGLTTNIVGQHLFEALLQRRAKPIRWKWKNDLSTAIKPPEVQRQRRFLPEPRMEKWWRTMSPPKIVNSEVHTTRENLEETIFRKPFFTTVSRTEHLTEKASRERQNAVIVNETQSFKEELSLQEKELPLNVFQSFSLPINPFDKDNHVIIVTDYLSPTENTYFNNQKYLDFHNIPQQREVEDETYTTDDTEEMNPTPSQHDVDSDFLREAIIHEHHKPSKFEIHSASERLKDSQKDFENSQNTMSSVEYIVPLVEHIVPEVEYADNISTSNEKQVSAVLSSVEYVTPSVEFVEPEVDYIIPDFNSSDGTEDYFEKEEEWGDDLVNPSEESFTDANEFPQENIEKKGLNSENNDDIFQIVALRRQQVRVRRNHKRHKEHIGVPELDYPTLEALPVVQFYCGDYMPGYYVDITTRCQQMILINSRTGKNGQTHMAGSGSFAEETNKLLSKMHSKNSVKKVFHLCDENGQRNSFLCPVGTIFNQKYLVCDWWYNVDCEDSSKYLNSETLQAYSTTNKKQEIMTKIDPVRKVLSTSTQETRLGNQQGPEYDESYNPNMYKNQNINRNPEQKIKKLPILAQKAVNYPMGYGILLREYMKNNAVNDKIKKDKNNIYKNDNKSNTKNTEYIFEKKPTFNKDEKTREYEIPEKTYSNIMQYPTIRNPYKTEDSPKLYINISLRHSQSNKQVQNKHDKTENKYSPYVHRSHISFLNVQADKSNTALETSAEKKPDLKNKQKTNKNIDNTRNFQKLLETEKPRNSHTNTKQLFKSTKDINRYHFIIDPKEAIRPASDKLFSMLHEQIKNNNSAIKFRHAESTLKHIKPYNSKQSFINNHNNSKVFKRPEQHSYVQYTSPTSSSDDHLVLNSAPRISKILNPTDNSNLRYGDRLSKHTRSIPLINEKLDLQISNDGIRNHYFSYNLQNPNYPNKTNQVERKNNTYALELKQKGNHYFSYNLQNPNYRNKTNQVERKNNTYAFELKKKGNSYNLPYFTSYNLQYQIHSNKSNLTERNNNINKSELQQSESRYDFPNFNNYSEMLLNNSENQKLKSGNVSFFKKDQGIDDSFMNKQKITISVHIETNAAIKNNGSILPNKNTSTTVPINNYTFPSVTQNNASSLSTLNPQFSYNNRSLGNFTNLQNSNKKAFKQNSNNATKVNNSHGGYLLVKEDMHKGADKAVNNYNKTYVNKAQKRTLSETMWNIPFFSTF